MTGLLPAGLEGSLLSGFGGLGGGSLPSGLGGFGSGSLLSGFGGLGGILPSVRRLRQRMIAAGRSSARKLYIDVLAPSGSMPDSQRQASQRTAVFSSLRNSNSNS